MNTPNHTSNDGSNRTGTRTGARTGAARGPAGCGTSACPDRHRTLRGAFAAIALAVFWLAGLLALSACGGGSSGVGQVITGVTGAFVTVPPQGARHTTPIAGFPNSAGAGVGQVARPDGTFQAFAHMTPANAGPAGGGRPVRTILVQKALDADTSGFAALPSTITASARRGGLSGGEDRMEIVVYRDRYQDASMHYITGAHQGAGAGATQGTASAAAAPSGVPGMIFTTGANIRGIPSGVHSYIGTYVFAPGRQGGLPRASAFHMHVDFAKATFAFDGHLAAGGNSLAGAGVVSVRSARFFSSSMIVRGLGGTDIRAALFGQFHARNASALSGVWHENWRDSPVLASDRLAMGSFVASRRNLVLERVVDTLDANEGADAGGIARGHAGTRSGGFFNVALVDSDVQGLLARARGGRVALVDELLNLNASGLDHASLRQAGARVGTGEVTLGSGVAGVTRWRPGHGEASLFVVGSPAGDAGVSDASAGDAGVSDAGASDGVGTGPNAARNAASQGGVVLVSGVGRTGFSGGRYRYRGAHVASVPPALAGTVQGAFSLTVDFDEGRFRYEGEAGNTALAGGGGLDAASGSLSSTDIELRHGAALGGMAQAALYGRLHGHGGRTVAGVWRSRDTSASYVGGFVGQRVERAVSVVHRFAGGEGDHVGGVARGEVEDGLNGARRHIALVAPDIEEAADMTRRGGLAVMEGLLDLSKATVTAIDHIGTANHKTGHIQVAGLDGATRAHGIALWSDTTELAEIRTTSGRAEGDITFVVGAPFGAVPGGTHIYRGIVTHARNAGANRATRFGKFALEVAFAANSFTLAGSAGLNRIEGSGAVSVEEGSFASSTAMFTIGGAGGAVMPASVSGRFHGPQSRAVSAIWHTLPVSPASPANPASQVNPDASDEADESDRSDESGESPNSDARGAPGNSDTADDATNPVNPVNQTDPANTVAATHFGALVGQRVLTKLSGVYAVKLPQGERAGTAIGTHVEEQTGARVELAVFAHDIVDLVASANAEESPMLHSVIEVWDKGLGRGDEAQFRRSAVQPHGDAVKETGRIAFGGAQVPVEVLKDKGGVARLFTLDLEGSGDALVAIGPPLSGSTKGVYDYRGVYTLSRISDGLVDASHQGFSLTADFTNATFEFRGAKHAIAGANGESAGTAHLAGGGAISVDSGRFLAHQIMLHQDVPDSGGNGGAAQAGANRSGPNGLTAVDQAAAIRPEPQASLFGQFHGQDAAAVSGIWASQTYAGGFVGSKTTSPKGATDSASQGPADDTQTGAQSGVSGRAR